MAREPAHRGGGRLRPVDRHRPVLRGRYQQSGDIGETARLPRILSLERRVHFDVQLFAVVQGVDVDLDRVVDEPVDQDRTVGADLGGGLDVGTQRVVAVHDLHAAPAEHVGRPDEDRVADLVGDPLRLGEAGRRAVRG